MAKALWQVVEQKVEEFFDQLAGADLFRFTDYGDLKYRSGASSRAKVATTAQPADYLLLHNGGAFLEVKSSKHSSSFPFKDVRQKQWLWAKKSVRSNSPYWFCLFSAERNRWYWVPAKVMLDHRQAGHSSIKWDLLEPYGAATLEAVYPG